MALERTSVFVGGKWQECAEGDLIELIDPSTEEKFARAPMASVEIVDEAATAARAAFESGPWPKMTRDERLEILLKMADFLEARSAEYGEQVLQETGLPMRFAQGTVMGAVGNARYVASIADSYQWEEERRGLSGVNTRISKVPVGVVAAIVPWNAPFSLSGSKVFPALLAGCTMILKASPMNALSLLAFGDAAEHAGLPHGVLSVFAAGNEASQSLVVHPAIDKIAFTGSDATGAAISAVAAPLFKRLTMELGGKSAGIVLPDTPLERLELAVPPAFTLNNGQACAAMTRLLVPRNRAEEIVSAVAVKVSQLVVGDPRDPQSDLGPLAGFAQYKRVLSYIDSARQDGGRIACGGGRPANLDRGYYLEPTIVTGVGPDSSIARDELFGPVLTVLEYDSVDEAVAIANSTAYGLSAAVFGADDEQLLSVANRMRSGSVHLNNGFTSDIGIPFGGFKASGFGREFGPEGIDAYVETRALFLDGQPYVAKR